MTNLPSFDTMLSMSPEELEDLRTTMVKGVIDSAPVERQRKLHGLQWRIDTTRALAKTPMAVCIELSRMMHTSLHGLRDALNKFSEYKQ